MPLWPPQLGSTWVPSPSTLTHARAYIYAHMHTHTHAHAHTHICTHMHALTHMRTHTCTHTHTHTDPLCPFFLHPTGQKPPQNPPRRVAQAEFQVTQPLLDPSRVPSVDVSLCEAGLWLGGLEFPLILGPNCVANLAACHCLQASEAAQCLRIRGSLTVSISSLRLLALSTSSVGQLLSAQRKL